MFANFKVGYISELTRRGTNLGIELQSKVTTCFKSRSYTQERGEAGILIAASVVYGLLLLEIWKRRNRPMLVLHGKTIVWIKFHLLIVNYISLPVSLSKST